MRMKVRIRDFYKIKHHTFAFVLAIVLSTVVTALNARSVLDGLITNTPLGPFYNFISSGFAMGSLLTYVVSFIFIYILFWTLSKKKPAKIIVDYLAPDAPSFYRPWVDRGSTALGFVGRKSETESLRAFCEDKSDYLWAIVAGMQGVGKSRLVEECMRDFDDDGWDVGYVSRSQDVTQTSIRRDTLFVCELRMVDEADLQFAQDLKSVSRVGRKLRLLFVAEGLIWAQSAEQSLRSSFYRFNGKNFLLVPPVSSREDIIKISKLAGAHLAPQFDFEAAVSKTKGLMGYLIPLLEKNVAPADFLRLRAGQILGSVQTDIKNADGWVLILLACICPPSKTEDMLKYVSSAPDLLSLKKLFPHVPLKSLDIEVPGVEPSLVRGVLALEVMCRISASLVSKTIEQLIEERPAEALYGISQVLSSNPHDVERVFAAEHSELSDEEDSVSLRRSRCALLINARQQHLLDSAIDVIRAAKEQQHEAGEKGDHVQFARSLEVLGTFPVGWRLNVDFSKVVVDSLRCASSHLYQLECNDRSRSIIIHAYKRIIHEYYQYSQTDFETKMILLGQLRSLGDAEMRKVRLDFSEVNKFDVKEYLKQTIQWVQTKRNHDRCMHTRAVISGKFYAMAIDRAGANVVFVQLADFLKSIAALWTLYDKDQMVKEHLVEFLSCALHGARSCDSSGEGVTECLSLTRILLKRSISDIGSNAHTVGLFAADWFGFALQVTSVGAQDKKELETSIKSILSLLPYCNANFTLYSDREISVWIIETFLRISGHMSTYLKADRSLVAPSSDLYAFLMAFFQKYVEAGRAKDFRERQFQFCVNLRKIAPYYGDQSVLPRIKQAALMLAKAMGNRPEHIYQIRTQIDPEPILA